MSIKKYAGDKIVGLSSDTKPTNLSDGATFYESDTGKIYILVSSVWVEMNYLDRFDGVGEADNFLYLNDTIPYTSGLYTHHSAGVISTYGHDYGLITSANEDASARQIGRAKALTFASPIILEIDLALTGSTGARPPAWGLGSDETAICNALSRDAGPEGSGSLYRSIGFREDAGSLYARATNGTTSTYTEVLISGYTLTNNNRYRVEWTPSVDAKFYVNGQLEATITTNIPTGSDNVFFGFGYRGSTGGYGIRAGMPRISY